MGQEGDRPTGGELNAAITRAIVRIHRDSIGRGPTRARAFFHDNVVVVVLEDLLVTAERTLLDSGQGDGVMRLRQELLDSMRADLTAAVETATDGHVAALVGDISLRPDIASLVFVLDRPVRPQPVAAG